MEQLNTRLRYQPIKRSQSMKHLQTFSKPIQGGSVLTEYLVVMAGLLIVYTGIDIALDFILQHTERYNFALELLF